MMRRMLMLLTVALVMAAIDVGASAYRMLQQGELAAAEHRALDLAIGCSGEHRVLRASSTFTLAKAGFRLITAFNSPVGR